MGMVALCALSPCCVQRDRNDMLDNIETRNDKLFLFSYPLLLKDIDRRIKEES